MKNLLKKMTIGGYMLLAGAVIALVALIVIIISNSPNSFDFWFVQTPWVILLILAAVACIGGALFFALKKGDGIIPTVLVIAAVMALVFALIQTIEGKQDVLGTVMFSDLEKGYGPAEAACYGGFTGMIIEIVSAVVVMVSLFFGYSKAEKAEPQPEAAPAE